MPQAIPFAVAYAASNAAAAIGASVATQATIAATAATVAASLQTTALIIGASYAIAKLNQPATPAPSAGSVEFKQPLPERFFPYGYCKLSGPVLFLETHNHDLLKITCFGTRELAGFEHMFFDGGSEGLLTTPPPGGGDTADAYFENWTSAGDLHGFVWFHLGSPDQVANTQLMAVYPTGWTEDHRLREIPYAFAQLQSGEAPAFSGAFPNGAPQFSVVAAVKVYDPRKDSTNGGSGSHRMDNPATWEVSDNQRLCTLDWLTWKDGWKKNWSRIDWATWVPQIEMADENVPLKAGGTEKRYRVATIASLDEPKDRVLHRLMQAGDQQLFVNRNGLIGSRGGVWQAPTVALDVKTMPEAQFTHGVPLMDRYNQYQLSAMLPEMDYNEVDLKEWSNAGDPDFLAGRVRRQPLDLTMIPSNAQAQRVAKITMMKANPPWAGSVRTNFLGLDALGEAAINLAFDELNAPGDTFDGPFFVNGKIAFLADKTGVTFPVAKADPAAYDWDPDTEEQHAPPLPADMEV